MSFKEPEIDTSETKAAFPDLKFADDDKVELQAVKAIEDENIILYLWDVNNEVYEIFKTLRNFINWQNYEVPPTYLVSLVKEEGYNLKQILTLFPYIYDSYIRVILTEKPNGV